MKVKIYLIIVLFNLSCLAFASKDSLQLAFKHDFEKFSKEIKTIQCDFSHEKEMLVLENKVVMNGAFYYDCNGNIRLSYVEPKGNEIIFTKEQCMFSVAGKKTVISIKSNPMLRQLSSMLIASMTGNIEMFEMGWEIAYKQTNEEYILTLIPKNKRAEKMVSKIVLHFEKQSMSLSIMQMVEQGGNISKYKFKNKRFNESIKPSVFDFN